MIRGESCLFLNGGEGVGGLWVETKGGTVKKLRCSKIVGHPTMRCHVETWTKPALPIWTKLFNQKLRSIHLRISYTHGPVLKSPYRRSATNQTRPKTPSQSSAGCCLDHVPNAAQLWCLENAAARSERATRGTNKKAWAAWHYNPQAENSLSEASEKGIVRIYPLAMGQNPNRLAQ